MSFKSSTSAVANSIGSSAAVGGAAAPVPALTAADLAAQDSAGAEELAAEEAQVEGEVDDALAMLLSLGERHSLLCLATLCFNAYRQWSDLQTVLCACEIPGEADQEVGRVAVSTVQKMLLNLHSNPGEQKLRSIRVSNKAFQSKVAAVPGGVELLLAAGYAYSGGGGDAATSTAAEGQTTAPEAGSGAAESSVQELFLVHCMDGPGARRLGYTLYRYAVLVLLELSPVLRCSLRCPRGVVLTNSYAVAGCRSCWPPSMAAIRRRWGPVLPVPAPPRSFPGGSMLLVCIFVPVVTQMNLRRICIDTHLQLHLLIKGPSSCRRIQLLSVEQKRKVGLYGRACKIPSRCLPNS
jgi:hypothetical protein